MTTYNTYDQQNNLLTSEDADGNVTSYTYDPLGNMISLTDTDGNTTCWTYDHDGQQTSQSSSVALGYYPDGTVQTTTATSYDFYDGDGNETTSIDADGRTIDYTYNQLNQETGEQWYDASGNQTGTVGYTYNYAGEMLTADNSAVPSSGGSLTPVASYAYNYDMVGNISDVTASLQGVNGGGTPIQLASDYDYNGNRTELAVNIGGDPATSSPAMPTTGIPGDFSAFTTGTNDFVNNYTYDWLGNMTSIVQTSQPTGTYDDVAPKTVTFAYDADQRLTVQNFYNADGTNDPSDLNSSTLVAAAAYSYDHDSDLTDLNYTDGAGNTVAGYHYDYTAPGIVGDEYSRNDSNAASPDSTYKPGSSNWAETTYSYDPTGNCGRATR